MPKLNYLNVFATTHVDDTNQHVINKECVLTHTNIYTCKKITGLNMFLFPINIGYFDFNPTKIFTLILVSLFSLLDFLSLLFRPNIQM